MPDPTPDYASVNPQGWVKYAPLAVQAAQKYGIPESMFLRLLAQESGFDPSVTNVKSGAAGIAQFMPDTAKDLGIDPMNPVAAIDASAKYLKQLSDNFGGDLIKAAAAYNFGQHNVEGLSSWEGDNNWIKRLPAETTTFLNNVVGGKLSIPPAPTSSTSVTGSSASSMAEPKIEDATYTNPLTGARDYGKFSQDKLAWLQLNDYPENRQWDTQDRAAKQTAATNAEKHADRGDLADYLDSVANASQADVASGNLTLSKAQAQFKKNLDAFDSGNTALSNVMGYSIPANAPYVTGFEPGGFAESIGLKPIKGSGQIYDPVQLAQSFARQSPDFTQLQTPTTMQDKAMAIWSNAGMAPAGSSAPPGPPPPPPTTPAPPNAMQQALQNYQQSQETTDNEQYMRQLGGY